MSSSNKIGLVFPSLVDKKNSTQIIEKQSFISKIFKKITKKKNTNFPKQSSFINIYDNLFLSLSKMSVFPIAMFYLNLEKTHLDFFEKIKKTPVDYWYIFPLYAQFSFSTTGSIADFFSKNLDEDILHKFLWIKSISSNMDYIKYLQKCIKKTLKEKKIEEKDTIFLFFTYQNDLIYPMDLHVIESEISISKIIKVFPYAYGALSFYDFYFDPQNDFEKKLEKLKSINRKNILCIPLNFFDTIKAENQLSKIIEKQNKKIYICNALNNDPLWIKSIFEIIEEKNFVTNNMLCPLM